MPVLLSAPPIAQLVTSGPFVRYTYFGNHCRKAYLALKATKQQPTVYVPASAIYFSYRPIGETKSRRACKLTKWTARKSTKWTTIWSSKGRRNCGRTAILRCNSLANTTRRVSQARSRHTGALRAEAGAHQQPLPGAQLVYNAVGEEIVEVRVEIYLRVL